MKETGETTGAIFIVLIAAQMYSRMLAISGVVDQISKVILGFGLSPILVVVLFLVMFVIMGMFLDSASILLLTVPITVPVVELMGFNIIWYGVISVLAIETGLITPPFGMSVFAIKSALAQEVEVEEIFMGSVPFLIIMFIVIAILVAFPTISTLLPSLM